MSLIITDIALLVADFRAIEGSFRNLALLGAEVALGRQVFSLLHHLSHRFTLHLALLLLPPHGFLHALTPALLIKVFQLLAALAELLLLLLLLRVLVIQHCIIVLFSL